MLEFSYEQLSSETLHVNGKVYRVEDLSFEDLRKRYGTGVGYLISDHGRGRKTYGYRLGIMTQIGDIELSVWRKLMRNLIEKAGEQNLYDTLKEWVRSFPWLKDEEDIEQYALELHSARIFDNAQWVDYLEFNQRYRPETFTKENSNEN